MRIAEISKAFKDATNRVLAKENEARMAEEKRKEDERKMNEAKIEEKRRLEEAESKREARTAKKRRSREKKRKQAEKATDAMEVHSKTDEASGEKVKVKASLRSKISELEMEEEKGRLAVASAIEEEKKSSLARESRLMIVREEKVQLEVELGDIEAAMVSLMERKRQVVKKQEEAGREVEELEKRRKDSEKSTECKIKDWTQKIENVKEELKVVHHELQLVEGRPRVNSDLEKFMERQIEELREELECPVCLEVATEAPIYKCTDDHIICRRCRPKLVECPQCRQIYPDEYKRFRGAEKQGEKLEMLLREKLQLV